MHVSPPSTQAAPHRRERLGQKAFQILLFAQQGHEMRSASSYPAAAGFQTNKLIRETYLLAFFF
jgi:hypothetical protein